MNDKYYAFANSCWSILQSQKEDATTFGVMATFVSHQNVSEDVVYEGKSRRFQKITPWQT